MMRIYNFRLLLTALLTLLVSGYGYAQGGGITVKGKVTDSQQNPLIGVAVVYTNGDVPTGVTTDGSGNYQITVADGEAILQVSYIGFETVSQKVDGRTTINFVLSDSSIAFDDVVVIGYGVQQKSHLTGAIAKLEGDVLQDIPVSDVATALQGQISGLAINQTTSEVGVTPEIRVRGISSVSAERSPLIVVDGFPMEGGLDEVNAADIASIEVLKDAASAAIYGSRAANGVIMITTKSGVVDKPKYSVKYYSGFKYAYKLHDLMSMQEVYEYAKWANSLDGSIITPANVRQAGVAAYVEENSGYTDWQRQALRDAATINNVQFSVQGGKNETRYYVSANYVKDKGLMLNNQVDKINFRAKIDTKLNRFMDFGVNMSMNYQKTTQPVNNFIDFYRTPSALPVYHNEFTSAFTGQTGFVRGGHFNGKNAPIGAPDANGNPVWEGSDQNFFGSSNPNPRSIMDMAHRGSESFSTNGNMYLSITIMDGLVFRTSNGVNYRFNPTWRFDGEGSKGAEGTPAEAIYSSRLYVDMLTENTLNYNKRFGKHDVAGLIGYTAQKTRNDYTHMTATGFPSDDIETLNAATIFTLVNKAEKVRGRNDGTGTFKLPNQILESYLARVNYSYDDKYLLSVATRLDRSSIFAKGNRDAWFPSASVGWRISEEEFMKPVTWTSSLKVRASYGVTGNNRINYTAPLELVGLANYSFGGGQGTLTPGLANNNASRGNPDITWEQTNEWNLGLDWGFINNRINLSVDAYYSITKALLLEQAIPSYTGYTKRWENLGKIRNKGLEFQLNTYNINKTNFKWETSANLSLTRNKVLELGGEYELINAGERTELYITRVGEPLIQFYGFKVIGNWNSQEEINDPNNASHPNDKVGSVRVWDANGDGVIDDNDRVIIGNPYPDFTWGLTNNFKIYNFDVSFLLQGVQGVQVLNGDLNYNETVKWNRKYVKEGWVSPEHPGSGKMSAFYRTEGVNRMLTDVGIEDASYLCLRNVTVGYTFSKRIANKIGLSSLRLYASGSNLFYIWSNGYRGINPESRMTSNEVTDTYGNVLITGYQRGGFPVTSTITFGLDFNF